MAAWQCSNCGKTNGPNDPKCRSCGTARPRASSAAQESVGSGSHQGVVASWRCNACETVNGVGLVTCSACGAAKGSASEIATTTSSAGATAVVTRTPRPTSSPSSAPSTGGPATSAPATPTIPEPAARGINVALIGALVIVIVVALALGALLIRRHSSTNAAATRSTSSATGVAAPVAPSAQGTAVVPSTPVPTPTTARDSFTTEFQTNWVNDPGKCGPDPTDQSQPYSPTRTYQVTATIHLWSAPNLSSTELALIPVTSNGPGGIGCTSGSDPEVSVICKTQGDTITGPFSSDPIWERVTWNGMTGYVPDEWVDTKWDSSPTNSNIPDC